MVESAIGYLLQLQGLVFIAPIATMRSIWRNWRKQKKKKKDLDGQTARWALLEGESCGGKLSSLPTLCCQGKGRQSLDPWPAMLSWALGTGDVAAELGGAEGWSLLSTRRVVGGGKPTCSCPPVRTGTSGEKRLGNVTYISPISFLPIYELCAAPGRLYLCFGGIGFYCVAKGGRRLHAGRKVRFSVLTTAVPGWTWTAAFKGGHKLYPGIGIGNTQV